MNRNTRFHVFLEPLSNSRKVVGGLFEEDNKKVWEMRMAVWAQVRIALASSISREVVLKT